MRVNKRNETVRPLWTPARLAFTVVVLFLVAAFGISSCSSADEKRPEQPTGPAASRTGTPVLRAAPAAAPAPLTTLPVSIANAELKAVSGAPITLSSYAGKVLVVNLWATWCGPCRSEIPELVKLYKEYRSQGLEIVGLSTEDPEDSAELVKNFVHDFDMSYRVGWSTSAIEIAFMQGRNSIPQSFVISREGQVVKRFVGFNPTTTPGQLKEAIQQALGQKAAD